MAVNEEALSRSMQPKQDKKVPLCINIHDGRLIANVKNVRDNLNYRPYRGNPNASLEERMAYISSSLTTGGRARVINTSDEDQEIFDIGSASKPDLVAFAMKEFNTPLNESSDIRTLRKQVQALHERATSGDNLSG